MARPVHLHDDGVAGRHHLLAQRLDRNAVADQLLREDRIRHVFERDDYARHRCQQSERILHWFTLFTRSRGGTEETYPFTIRRTPSFSVASPKLIKSPTRRSIIRR